MIYWPPLVNITENSFLTCTFVCIITALVSGTPHTDS